MAESRIKKNKRKFDYLEIIKILSNKNMLEQGLAGHLGSILGYDFVDGIWIYTVDIVEMEFAYSIDEVDMISTGEFDEEKKFYPSR